MRNSTLASVRPPASRRRALPFPAADWAAPLAAAVVAVVMYGRSIGFAFIWDDLDLIVRHADLQGPMWAQTLKRDFWSATGGGTGMWRPLVTLSYRIDGVLSGWTPAWFHAVNVLGFALAAGLLARLAQRRGASPTLAALAGACFACAPSQAEAVAWVAGRTDVFVAVGTLLALLGAGEARRGAPRRGLAAAVLGTGVALLAKETAVVVPALLALDAAADASVDRARAALRAAAPALVLVACWAFAHRAFADAPAHAPEPGALLAAPALLWSHLAWLAPWAPHAPLLPVWQAPSALPIALAAIAALAAGMVMVLLACRGSVATLPLALLLLPLVPVASAVALEAGTRYAERSLMLSVAGLALGLATFAGAARWRRLAWPALAFAVFVALQASFAWRPIAAWASEESRIRRVVEVRPAELDALLGLADLLSTEGREDEARSWIERAMRQAPDDPGPWRAQAALAFRAGRPTEAVTAAERALALAPDDLAAGVVRVRALVASGRVNEAVVAGEALVAANASEPPALGASGVARLASGDAEGAYQLLTNASSRLLEDAGLAYDLGRAAVATGRIADARGAFERAVTAAPGYYAAWLGVADTRARLGDAAGAEEALQRAAACPGADDRVERLRQVMRVR